jgi:hypothetical protein
MQASQVEEIAKVLATEDELRMKAAAEEDGWSDDDLTTDTARAKRRDDMRSRLLAATGKAVVGASKPR